ncbi:hypothetical protein F5B20DRAFT_374120 [Whalleya microplaca]|nr:hypothetical protein F5B20DRAFT_374120 [Whalleya microplaca]
MLDPMVAPHNPKPRGMEGSSTNAREKLKNRKDLRTQLLKSKQRGHRYSTRDETTISEKSASSHKGTQTTDLAEKLERQRRIDDIVKDHIDDFPIVYDKPSASRRTSRRNTENKYLMSGALMSHLLENSGEDPEMKNQSDGVNSASVMRGPVQETRCASWTDGLQGSLEPLFADPFTQDSPTLYTKKAQRLRSSQAPLPIPIEGPRTPKFTPKVVPRVSPTFGPTTPDSMCGAIVSDKEQKNKVHGSHRAKFSGQSRKETVIPAPEP